MSAASISPVYPAANSAFPHDNQSARYVSRSTFNSLQCGRGIAALAIVLFHTLSVLAHKIPGASFPLLAPACSGVDFFFVLSGFIIMNAHRKDLGNPSRVPSFLYRRFIRIYPLYLLLTLVTISLYNLHLGAFTKLDPGIITKSFLLFPQESGIKPLLAPGWTLCHEAFFYLIFAAFVQWGTKVRLALLSVIGTLTLVNCFITLPGPYWIHTWMFSPYNIEFASGCLANLLLSRRLRWALFPGLGLLLTSWFLTVRYSLPTTDAAHMVIRFGLPYFLIVLGATSFEIRKPLAVPRPLLALGDATYSVYLSHFMIVSALGTLFARLPIPFPVSLVVIPAIAVPLGYLIYARVERPMLSYLRSRESWITSRRNPRYGVARVEAGESTTLTIIN